MGIPDGVDQLAAGLTSVPAEILGNPSMHNAALFANGAHRAHARDMSSPLLNAKASLDVLSNLCEHSGWKWADGMLLGGCLHYGLEHYEEALDWFKRIISLDERYTPTRLFVFFFFFSLAPLFCTPTCFSASLPAR